MKRPFLNIVLVYIIGLLFFYYIDIDRSIIFILSLMFLFGSLYSKNKKKKRIYFFMLIFILSGLILYLQMNSYDTKDFINRDKDMDTLIIIEELSRQNDYLSTYEGKIKNIIYKNKNFEINEKAMIKIKTTEEIPYGTLLRGKAKILSPKSNTNKGLFDYSNYLATKKIHSIVEFDSAYEILGKKELKGPSKIKMTSKEYIENFLDTSLNDSNSGIMKAIILGEDSLLDEDYKEKYRELGIAHILAISGLHIGIISAALLFLLSNIGVSYRISAFITIIFIFTYGYIVGFPASILRASIVLAFIIISKVSFKRPDYINILSLVCLLLLVYNPLWIFDVGFQLSFIATISIVVLTPLINKRIFSEIRFKNILSALIAVQLGTLPILIYHFNYVSLTSLFSNIFLIPLLSYILVSVMFLIFLSTILFNTSVFFMNFINLILDYFSKVVDFHHEYLNVVANSVSWRLASILIYYMIIWIFLHLKDLRRIKLRYIYMFFYSLLIITILNLNIYSSFKWSINFIDVGQGDSVLVRIKDKKFLIDTGGNIFSDYDVGEKILIPYLLKNNINHIDGVFISHFHEDHVEGLISLLKSDIIEVDKVYYNGNNVRNNLYEQIKYLSQLKGIQMIDTVNNSRLQVHNIASFKFFNDEVIDEQENDNTNIISLYADNTKILFMGDAEKPLEDKFINYNEDKYDIIKLGHHGSNTSTSIDFINDTSPEIGIISVGKNSYGHPDDGILENLKAKKVTVKRTDLDGNVLIKNNYKDYDIYCYKEKTCNLKFEDIFHIIFFVAILLMNKRYIEFQDMKEKIDGI